MRVPIRLRLTLSFAAVMALLLVAAGAFLFVRLDAGLLRTLDSALRAQADVVASGIGQGNMNFGDQTHPLGHVPIGLFDSCGRSSGAGGRNATRCRYDLAVEPRPAGPHSLQGRRDHASGRDAELDARSTQSLLRSRAAIRRRRES